MSDPAARLAPDRRALLEEIGRVAGRAGIEAYLVGGPVRDLVMHRVPVDLDLTVEGDGIDFAARLAHEMHGVVKGHQRFGTAVLVLPGGVKIDLATARRESYPRPGALPVVEGGSLREDLYRRDFTINSMAMPVNPPRFGTLIDLFDGRRDIEAGVIRVLHEGSFIDDPTRVYRAVRFSARFGFEIEPGTIERLEHAVGTGSVDTVSGDRIRQELLLILREEDAHAPLRRLSELGLFAAIHPAFRPGAGELELATRLVAPASTLHLERLLALLARLTPADAAATMARLGMKGQVARWWQEYRTARERALPVLESPAPLAPSALRRLLARYHPPALRILAGLSQSELAAERISRYLDELRGVRILVGGSDLAALGIAPGPRYAGLLGAVLDARLDGRVRSRADELELLRTLAAAGADDQAGPGGS